MVAQKFILALCCSVGVALPIASMAQMPPTDGTSMPTSGGMMSPAPSKITSPAPSGGMMPPPSGGMMKSPHKTPSTVKPGMATAAKTSVNTATLKELIKVNGIGTVTAKKIMTGRPYATLDELVTKKILTKKQLTQLESKIGL
jgi:competence protein ComEA